MWNTDTSQTLGSFHDSEIYLSPPPSKTKKGPQSYKMFLHCSSQLVLLITLRETQGICPFHG